MIAYSVPVLFLSTLPARGATKVLGRTQKRHLHFYPRSPRGERQKLPVLSSEWIQISIHAPREGSDKLLLDFDRQVFISIHAPREGSDLLFLLS